MVRDDLQKDLELAEGTCGWVLEGESVTLAEKKHLFVI